MLEINHLKYTPAIVMTTVIIYHIHSSTGVRHYLKVFDVGEGNANSDHCSSIVISEVQSLTHFPSAYCNQQRSIYKKVKLIKKKKKKKTISK